MAAYPFGGDDRHGAGLSNQGRWCALRGRIGGQPQNPRDICGQMMGLGGSGMLVKRFEAATAYEASNHRGVMDLRLQGFAAGGL